MSILSEITYLETKLASSPSPFLVLSEVFYFMKDDF